MKWKPSQSVENQLALGVVASVVVLIVVGWLSYATINRLVATDKWVLHTQKVIASLESGLTLLMDAETKQRGYLLTGNDQFLRDCQSAQAQITGWMREIRQLTADNSQSQQNLDKLQPMISQRLALLNNRVELRQSQGLEAVIGGPDALLEGRALMDHIQATIAEMRATEIQLLAQRQESARASASLTELIVIGVTVLASVTGIAAFFLARHDLALRTRAQLQLKASQALMESILDNTPALVFIKDLDGRYLFVNRRFSEIAGRPREEIIGKTVAEISQKELARTAAEHFHAVIKSEQPLEVEETVIYPEGPRPHFAVKFPVRDVTGKIYGMAGISTDISERKQVERMRLQFQILFESLPGLFLVLKPDFTILAVSDAYLKSTLTERGAILGKNLFEVFPDNPADPTADGTANLKASLQRVLQSGQNDTMPIQRYDVRRPDGVFEVRYWSPINSPIFGPDDQVEYIIHRVEDVTEFVLQKSSENPRTGELARRMELMEAEIFQSSLDVKAANEKLRTANQELEAFSYSVSHDLRAPLRHIDGFVDLLRKQADAKLSDRERRYLNIIADSARQMGMLIDDLLVFSRMGRTELRRTKVVTNSLLDEVIRAVQGDVNGRKIDWKIPDLPVVEADPAMLRQVWFNLIANAVKYTRTRDPAQIEVGFGDGSDNEWVFFVRDNGVGFDMQYVHKLFGVFQRLHRAEEFEGTGIGLANVRRIIARHEGRTWAEGCPDAGAAFYFSLPKPKK